MFEIIGLLIDLTVLFGIAILTGGFLAALAWFLFWGRCRPKLLILFTSLIPIFSLAYLVICAICLEIFVPNQPDLFFGDFNEPLPNGYILTGLGKMPEFSYFESTPPMMHQPPMLGGVRRLEQDGENVYGAYGPLHSQPYDGEDEDRGYFVFDTLTGQVRNLKTLDELNAAAGHEVHMVDSQLFKSQEPGRILLRKIENVIFYGPPAVALLFFIIQLLRQRLKLEGATFNQLQN